MICSVYPSLRLPVGLVGGAIATSLVTMFSIISPGTVYADDSVGELLEDNPKAVLDEAWQIINREYVDDTFNQVDWLAVRERLLSQDYSSTTAAYRALQAELRLLQDPYTRFLNPQEYSELTDQTAGEVSGVGLQLRRDRENRAIYITDILPGSPAEQSGLRAGDRIVLVNGQSTERLSVNGVTRLLRGEENSQVTLTYSRNDSRPFTVILTRARLELPTVDYRLQEVDNYRIGYIRLSEFNGHATEQMVEAIETLLDQQAEAFVLDLRGNPGGLLSASIEISRLWLQRGPIVQTLYRSGEPEQISANRTALTDLPLAVLVNDRSASSSEILTGALQDNDRATVVGSTTYGKALVQSLYGLSDGSGLAVTVAHYYTPDGTDISQRGITPDVEVELSSRARQALFSDLGRLGSEQDVQFLRAVSSLETTIQTYRSTPQAPSQLGRSPDQ
ncbi:MAG: PDZ domain-containing protein [Leptolyngbya sp. SIO1D8]|nr:PDZ domain-containing protein [Leptolyngbya sp. SIO1D8]